MALPDQISLADAFARVMLEPHEVATLLAHWGQEHRGTAQVKLADKLVAAAAVVVDPDTYEAGGKKSTLVVNAGGSGSV